MFERLSRLLKRRGRDPERLREETESRLRAQQEIRQAEQGKSESQRGLEGASKGFPFGRP
jgi:hypothetical protein